MLSSELLHCFFNLCVDLKINLCLTLHKILLLQLGVDIEVALRLGYLGLKLLVFWRADVETLDLFHHAVDAVPLGLEAILRRHDLILHLVHRHFEAGVILKDVANIDDGYMVCRP